MAHVGSSICLVLALAGTPAGDSADGRAAEEARAALAAKHGTAETSRIDRGVAQVRRYWREEDGDPAAFAGFVKAEFLPQGATLDATFHRFEYVLERLDGYMTSLGRDLKRGVDLEIGPLLPLDERLSAFDPAAHLPDDLFASRIAFVALLNFPLTTLEERLAQGPSWSRRQWAEARLAQRFSSRVPADVNARITAAFAAADTYVAGYNVFMHHVLARDGKRLFEPGKRLLSHWNLRDEIKARYADPEGLPKQRLMVEVMDAIVRQAIPEAAIDNPLVDWTPSTGAVAVSTARDAEAPAGRTAQARPDREPDTRYARWLEVFRAARLADPYFPDNPTLVDRRFNLDREIPEKEVQALFEAVLDSPVAPRVARVIEERLGRRLEPFDVWYPGFKPGGKRSEAELDAMTRKRYPSAAAYAADMPRMLVDLGFSAEKARFLAERIEVEPARGSGHAAGGARRDDKAHLRTRVGPSGMDYKGYNIAVHEMGHNVEQVFSVTTIDHTLLQGVPNTAFTEAMAFVFQARDLELLGLGKPDPGDETLRVLGEFWATREIAGVSLVDMAAWRWLYAHPDATPAQFREAVVAEAQRVWNRWFAPHLGGNDQALFGIYSHLVHSGLYTPDYTIGHLIAFQIEDHFARSKDPLGQEFERMVTLGNLTPDQWMRRAVGAPISARPLLDATEAALATLGR
jgi:hypothetical protein